MSAKPKRPKSISRKFLYWVSKGGGRGLPLRKPLALVPTGMSSSLEGVGLSVSLHPAAWSQIARLGGDAYRLERIDGKPGKFALHDPHMHVPATLWGVEAGWVTRAHQWEAPYYDSEADEDMVMLFDDEDGAREQVRDMEGDEDAVRRVDAVDGTPRMREHLERWFEGLRGSGRPLDKTDAAIELLNLYVTAHWPDLDGLWWDERLDPSAYSAPRGVILPYALGRWQAVSFGPPDQEDEGWE
jgi:hypothetical protein